MIHNKLIIVFAAAAILLSACSNTKNEVISTETEAEVITTTPITPKASAAENDIEALANELFVDSEEHNSGVKPLQTSLKENEGEPKVTEEASEREAEEKNYILNTNTKKYHYESCSSVKQMKEHNKEFFTGSSQEAQEQGYKPCKMCNP